MSRRPNTANAVSLFPFLAVLVCAMGALIFLLLVTTRLIREEVLSEQQASTGAESVSTVAGEPPAEECHRLPPALAPLPEPPAKHHHPILPELADDPPKPDTSQRERLLAEWQSRVEHLRSAAKSAAEVVASREAKLQQTLTAAQEAHASLESLRGRLRELDSQRTTLQGAYDGLQRKSIDLASELADLRGRLAQAEHEMTMASSKYQILPYDGHSGATRRPIVIECSEGGLTFVSEGVTLTPADVEGFTERFNPLLAGAEALITYWDERAMADDPRPYVLLVVRPGGTVAYYVARQLLEKLSEPFGYELVPADQQFQWPDSDPRAAAACRSAIDNLLRERDHLRTAVAGAQVPGRQQLASDEGGFYLPEVERLRRSGREVTFNGRQWSREPEPTPASTESWSGIAERAGEDASSRGQASNRSHAAAPGAGSGAPARPPASREGGPEKGLSSSSLTSGRQPPSTFLPPKELQEMPHTSDVEADTEGSKGTPEYRGGPGDDEAFAEALARMMPQTSGGSPSASPEASHLIELHRQQQRKRSSEIDPKSPKWGIQNPQGSIGFEREIIVQVTPGRVTVANETSFPIESGVSADGLRQLLAVHLNTHVTSWGPPPQSFYWVPAVRFVVSPGGNQFQRRLESLVKQWGLRSTVEYALE